MRFNIILSISLAVGISFWPGASRADPVLADFETDEYLANIGLAQINASAAYLKGFTGEGSIIAIVDAGYQLTHPEFDDPIIIGASGIDSHGTHVAGIAAAIKDDTGMHGVAYDARLALASWSNPGAKFVSAAELGAAAISNSWGFDVSIQDILNDGDYPTDPYQALANTVGFTRNYWETFVTSSLTAQENSVILFAAANVTYLSDIDVSAGLPLIIPELQGAWIAVVNVKQDGTLKSSPCGSAASFCLGAPGTNIYSSVPIDSYSFGTGTSMATPHVAGAIAIAKQIFPMATPEQLASVVLQTATDIGEPGIDSDFGWGFLNLGNLASTVDRETAELFPASSWSSLSVLDHVNATVRHRMYRRNDDALGTGASVYSAYSFGSNDGENGLNNKDGWRNDNVWVAAVGGQSSLEAGEFSSGYDADSSGVVLGTDGQIDQYRRSGVAAGLTQTDLNSNSGVNHGAVDGAHILAYTSWEDELKFAGASAQLAFFRQSLERNGISGADGTSARVVGHSSTSSVGVELDFKAGRKLNFEGVEVAPFLSAIARWQDTAAFTETGAGIFSLSVPSSTIAQLEVGPGIQLDISSIKLGPLDINLGAEISYSYLAGDRNHATSVDLLGTQINSWTADVGRHVIRIGSQIRFTNREKAISGIISYRGGFQDNANSQSLTASLSAIF